jgi:hypothetical protein
MSNNQGDLFLKVLNNKPKRAPASGKESPNVKVLKKVPDEKSLTRTSFQKQKGGAHKYVFVGRGARQV